MPVAITYERASLKASLNRREISGRGAASAGRAAEGVADGLPDSIKTAFFRMIGRACSLDAALFSWCADYMYLPSAGVPAGIPDGRPEPGHAIMKTRMRTCPHRLKARIVLFIRTSCRTDQETHKAGGTDGILDRPCVTQRSASSMTGQTGRLELQEISVAVPHKTVAFPVARSAGSDVPGPIADLVVRHPDYVSNDGRGHPVRGRVTDSRYCAPGHYP